tara:strand:- start:994 stop:1287 length:294 start_codon:yes stop_codon:yes gene_type:complete
MSKKKDLDTLINEALCNIRSDRQLAREFLNDIANEIVRDAEKISRLSPVAAKHVEVLQRSNEQLVKLISMQHKHKEAPGLSDEDKNSIFDMLQEPSK